jgi:type IV pilus assembly protein PilC
MKLYYRAVAEDNKVIRGIIEAKTVEEAAIYLRQHDLTPIKILQEDTSWRRFFSLRKKVNQTAIIFFTRQLSSMLSSGLTLMQSLVILRKQLQNEEMADTTQGLISSIEEGSTLSLAMAKYPRVFSPIYVSLVKAAEDSGVLDKVMLRLAENLEKQQKLKQKIRGALLYPAIVVVLMIVVVSIMMIFVIPQLSVLYDNLGIELPISTRIAIGISNLFVAGWPVMLLGGFGFLYYLRRLRKSETGRLLTDGIVLRIPIAGKLITESVLTEFTRTFGLLVGTGTLIVDALVKSADVVGNEVFKKAILGVNRRVEKGVSIGAAMAYNPIFPPIIVEMVKIGEQTGKLDESLVRVSEYFDREVEQTVRTLTTAIEPVIMIVLAVGVGFLILSIITPIYSLINSIQ